MDLDSERPAKLVTIESKKSQERSGQIMGAHTPVLGKGSGGKGKGVRIAKINFDGSSMNVQIVGFEYVRRAEMVMVHQKTESAATTGTAIMLPTVTTTVTTYRHGEPASIPNVNEISLQL
ncbi:MAG: hypothetical protein Q9192_007150 [Flavoplaca navasiana]